MKKIISLLVVSAFLFTLMPVDLAVARGVGKGNAPAPVITTNDNDSTNDENNSCESCEPEETVDLIAGQNNVVGTVTVTNDDEKICVTYALDEDAIDEGWGIYETHLAIEKNPEDIPQTKGNNWGTNPIPGLFPYGDDELDGVEEWTHCIPLEELEEVDMCDDVHIAAHAVVKKLGIEPESLFFESETGIDVYGPIYESPDENTDWGDPVSAVKAINNIPSDSWVWGEGNDYNPDFDPDIDGVIWISTNADTEIWWEDSWRKVIIPFDVGDNALGSVTVNADNEYWVYLNGSQIGWDNDIWDGPETYPIAPDPGTHELVFIWMNWKQGTEGNYNDQRDNPNGLTYLIEIEYDEVVVLEEQTAWGEGERFNERGNWGMYFKYKICESEECVPAHIIYGVTGDGSTGSLWQIEFNGDAITETKLIDILDVGGATNFYPNGLAYDDVNNRLYFAIRKSGVSTANLYFYDFNEGIVEAAIELPGEVYGATWGDGKYWYIRNGSNDMLTVTFDGDGVNGVVEMFEANFAGGKSFNFGDMALDPDESVIYISTSFSGSNKEFFKYDLTKDAGERYSLITTTEGAVGLQLGFGEDGVLYGHSTFGSSETGASAKEWFAVDKSGTVSSLGNGVNSYNDLASGPSICK